jgi:alkylation response protein AidB-like acyl-CoA dehydrogenase
MHATAEFDAALPAAARDLVGRATAFAAEVVAPAAPDWEREGRFPREAIRAACAQGFAAIEVPVARGGLGLPFGAKLRMVEEIARHDFGFAFSLVNQHNAASRIADHGSPAAVARFVPALMAGELIGCTGMTEPGGGSDFAASTTVARRATGGWVLDGAKHWIVNAAQADVCITFAQTEPGSRDRGIAGFIVTADQPGFERAPALAVAGVRAAGTGGYRLHACFVPDAQLLYPPGQAFKAAMGSINKARAHIPAMCCGMIETALGKAVARGASREAFGLPLLGHQGLRWSLAGVATTLEALRLLTYRAAGLIDRGLDAQMAAALAKKFAGEHTLAAIAACIQAMGAEGLLDEHGLGRHLAAAKVMGFTDGTTEIMNERIGRMLEAPVVRAGVRTQRLAD